MFDIVEVEETGKRGANVLLSKGYRLISVDVVSKLKSRKDNPQAKATAYVQKDFVYVLGRSEQIPKYVLQDSDFEPAIKELLAP